MRKPHKKLPLKHTAHKLTPELETRLDALRPIQPVTYPYAAMLWNVTLKEAIEIINELVCCGKLRGTEKTGYFVHVKEEKW